MAEWTDRRGQIIQAARRLLEEEGADALTMRRLATRVGIKAPSLYKHLPDKAALEILLITDGLTELAEALEAAERREPGSLDALASAFRAFALAHPHLYRLIHDRPLPREALPGGLEDRTAAPVVRVVGGDQHRARAVWAFAHGMVSLELNGRFPPDADLTGAWRTGARAFAAGAERAGAGRTGTGTPR